MKRRRPVSQDPSPSFDDVVDSAVLPDAQAPAGVSPETEDVKKIKRRPGRPAGRHGQPLAYRTGLADRRKMMQASRARAADQVRTKLFLD